CAFHATVHSAPTYPAAPRAQSRRPRASAKLDASRNRCGQGLARWAAGDNRRDEAREGAFVAADRDLWASSHTPLPRLFAAVWTRVIMVHSTATSMPATPCLPEKFSSCAHLNT